MMDAIYWALPVTLLIFFIARKLALYVRSPLMNPLIISIVVIIPLLLLTHTPYPRYFEGTKWLNALLQPAVVALAYPLYMQLPQIKAHWKSISIICLSASLFSMITGVIMALALGATPDIAASLIPKSVTLPIAMTTVHSLNGTPAITVVAVMLAGIFGAVLGHTILNKLGIHSESARGLAIGSVSHALGTARCAEVDYQEGAFSSLALVLCGIMTSLIAPFLFPVLIHFFSFSG